MAPSNAPDAFVATPWVEDGGVCLFCGTAITMLIEQRTFRVDRPKRGANGEILWTHATHGMYGHPNSRHVEGRPCYSQHVRDHIAELTKLVQLGEQLAELVPVNAEAINRTKQHLRTLQHDLEDG